MSQKTEEAMAVADVYARALLGAAAERGEDEAVAAAFDDLAAFMSRDASFASFLTSDTVDDDPRRASLERLFRGRMHDLLLNLLQVLNNRRRLALLPSIHRCVVLQMESKRRQKEVTVETAMPLPEDLKAAMKARLSEHIGREALLTERVRPELLGGVVIRIDDVQIDGSVAGRMRRLRSCLNETAVRAIHEHRGCSLDDLGV